MKDYPDETPPWWDATLMRRHPDNTPPWWETTLMRRHSDETPPLCLKAFFLKSFPSYFPVNVPLTLTPPLSRLHPAEFGCLKRWIPWYRKYSLRISVPVFEGVIFSFLFSHCLFLWLQYNSSVVSRLWWDRNSRGSTYSSHVRGQWPKTDDHTHREWEFQVLCWCANSWSIPQGNEVWTFFLGLTAYSWIIT